MRLSMMSLGLACLLVVPPSSASVRHRLADHRPADSGAARVHGTVTNRPEARRAWHVGGTAADGAGDLSHARAGGGVGPNGRIAGGHRTTVERDGTVTRQGGVVARGANGGSVVGERNVQRSPDGSMQAGYTFTGHGAAGGSFSQSGSRTRTAGGERLASRQTRASGARGSYAGDTLRAGGTLEHTGTFAGANGNSYEGQTRYTCGEGLTHTSTCTDARGQTFDCK